MTKDFYENIIASAEDLGQLRVIHKFLVCDLHIQGGDYREISKIISTREANILLDMQTAHLSVYNV